MKTILVSVCLSLALLWQGPAQAADLSPVEVAKKVQAAYAATKTITADFQQTTSSRGSGRDRQGAGSMTLAKPGLMRWDYREPDPQVFVCDGKKISMYFAREGQMLVSPAKEYLDSDVTYAFFAGTGDILRDFTVSGPAEEDIINPGDTYQLTLIPKQSHPQIEVIALWVDRKTFLMQRLKVTDKFGAVTDLVFANLAVNPEVPASIFQFTPPEGTEIIDK